MRTFRPAVLALCACWSPLVARAQTPELETSERVSLAFALPQGYRFDTIVTEDARRVVRLPRETPVPTRTRTVLTLQSSVVAVAANGAMTLENTFRAMKIRQQLAPGFVLEYDSAQATNEAATALSRIYKPLLGQKYQVVVGPDGTIQSVSGVSELVGAMLAALRKEGVPEAAIAGIKADFERTFNATRLREQHYSATELPPLLPIAAGELWTRRFRIGDPEMPLIVLATAQITEKNGNALVVRELGDLALDVGATRLGQSPVPITTEFSGTHRGGTRWNLDARTRTSRLVHRFNAAFSFVAPSRPNARASRQAITIAGQTDYLIEVKPVQ